MSGVHFIDGQHYVEVNRQANIGDYITKDGILRTVTRLNEGWDIVEFDDYVDDDNDNVCGWGNGTYKTLEPLEATVDYSQASEQVIEMFTALSRKIVSLESQLRATQRNLETFAEQTESNTQDIAMLDSRTYSLTATDSVEGILNEIERLLSRRGDR